MKNSLRPCDASKPILFTPRWVLILVVSAFLSLDSQTHAGIRTWDGGGANSNWNNATNWVGDVAPIAGDDLIFPIGPSNLSPFNNFPAGTTFNSIIITGTNYGLTGNAIALNAGINATNTIDQNYFSIAITLNSNQSITTGNVGVNFNLSANIDTNGKDLTFAGNGTAQVQSVISGSGGLIKTGSGTVSLYSSNTFAGPVQINQSSLSVYNGNALGSTNGNTTVASGAFLILINPITVPEPLVLSGSLNAATAGKTLTGPITLATNITMQIFPGATLTINSVVSGPGGFTINAPSAGSLILNSNNTYAGAMTLNDGVVSVNGSQPGSPVILNKGAVGGTGTVGTIATASSGAKTIYPGGFNTAGILTCSNVVMSNLTTLQIDLNGTTPGSGYDRLNVNGTVTITNASLFASSTGLALVGGEQFIIVNNDGVDAINGTFNSLPEGATVSVGTNQLKITYVGGDGNDVVLFKESPPAQLTAITALANGVKQIDGIGLSNLTYTIQAASNLNPVITWTNLGSATANGSGVFMFNDTNAAGFPMRFYRAKSP